MPVGMDRGAGFLKKSRWWYWGVVGLCLAALAAVLLVVRFLQMDLDVFTAQYKDSLAAVPIVVGIYLLKAATLFILPQPVVYLTTGLLFSPLAAFLLTIGCLAMEFTLDYLIGRRFGRRLLDKLVTWLRGHSRFLDRVLDGNRLDNFSTIALLRLFPGVSTDAVSLLSGANEVRFSRYFFASMAGCAPQAIAVTLMGSSIQDFWSPQFLIPAGALLLVMLLSILIKRRLDR